MLSAHSEDGFGSSEKNSHQRNEVDNRNTLLVTARLLRPDKILLRCNRSHNLQVAVGLELEPPNDCTFLETPLDVFCKRRD
jgi:hypothetical protein